PSAVPSISATAASAKPIPKNATGRKPTKMVANSRFADIHVQKSWSGLPWRSRSGMYSMPPGSTATTRSPYSPSRIGTPSTPDSSVAIGLTSPSPKGTRVAASIPSNGPMLDLLLTGARIAGSPDLRDLAVLDGRLVAPEADARQVVHLDGALVTPPLVEPHIHLDAVLTVGQPRYNQSGSLFEGIAIWTDRVRGLTVEDVKAR